MVRATDADTAPPALGTRYPDSRAYARHFEDRTQDKPVRLLLFIADVRMDDVSARFDRYAGRVDKRTFLKAQDGGVIAKRHRADQLFLVNMSNYETIASGGRASIRRPNPFLVNDDAVFRVTWT